MHGLRCPQDSLLSHGPRRSFIFRSLGLNATLNHKRINYVVTELSGEELKCLGSDDGQCDEINPFLSNAWNDLRNWYGYGTHAPSYADIA